VNDTLGNTMKMNKLFLAMSIISASAVMTGCGSDSESADPVPRQGEGLSFVTCNEETKSCTLEGTMDKSYTLDADYEYRLSGLLQVGKGNLELDDTAAVTAVKAAGVTLTIEPGVSVKANSDGVLLVTRGSKLMAEGTATNPITFSSKQDADFEGEGEWGGVVIQGLAPQYGAGNTGICGTTVCNVAGEGGDFIGNYGGLDKADNSGILKYVRIAEAGKVAGPNNEINGLTLQGVGHGTTIEYIQVHGNQDDGIEWFGGTVNVKYAVLTNNDDDDLDFDEGYQGNIQHVLIRKHPTKESASGSNDPRGIEANSSDTDYVPDTKAVLANITVYGGMVSNWNGTDHTGKQPGMRLRGSVTVNIYNTVVANFADECVRVDYSNHDDIDTTPKEPSIVNLTNVMASDCNNTFDHETPDTNVALVEEVASFDTAWALTNTAATLDAVPTITALDNGSNFTFDQTDYIGAVKPGTAEANTWYAGWIIEGSLD